MSRLLQEGMAAKVEVRKATSAVAAVEAIGAGHADAAMLPLFEYLLAHGEYGATPILQVIRRDGAASYRGVILVRKEANISSVEGLAGKKVAYVDRYSTSGYLFPRRTLAGVNVVETLSGSHAASLTKILAGEVDAIATFEGAEEGHPELAILASTDPIPNEPVFVRMGLDPASREALAAAFMKLGSTEEGRGVLARLGGITGYRPIGAEGYASVTATLQALGKRPSELVKDGHKVNPAPVEMH